MALPMVRDDLNGLDPKEAQHYKKDDTDGKFYLDAPGGIVKAKFDGKLQESNTRLSQLSKELEAAKAEAAGRVDKAEVAKLQSMLDDIENGKGGEKFLKAVEKQVASIKAAAEESSKIAKERESAAVIRAEKAETGLKTHKIRGAVQSAAGEVGLRMKNAEHYLQLSTGDFELVDDGKGGESVVAVKRGKNADGTPNFTPILGEDYNPVPIKDFIAKSHRGGSYDVFFEQGAGGGAPGNGKPAGSPGGFRLTREQASDPIVYQQTADAARKANTTVTVEPGR